MKRTWLAALTVVLVPTMFCVSPGWGQQKRSFTYKSPGTTKYTQQHVIDVGDLPGHHQVRVFEAHTTWEPTGGPRYEDLRVVETWDRGASGYTNGTGSFRVYTTAILENGDRIFWQASGTTQTAVQSNGTRTTRFHSAGSTIGATGKMRGVRGVSQTSGAAEFREGKAVSVDSETRIEYWFE